MTHDELLAKVSIEESDGRATSGQRALALRAVVELHEPQRDHCSCCPPVLCECAEFYPCPTIQAIEKELA